MGDKTGIQWTMDDAGNLNIQSTMPPFVLIGLLAQASALLTVKIATPQPAMTCPYSP